jgi:hypothetical protein
MSRCIVAIAIALFFISHLAAQPTPEADKAIKDAIATLKKKQATTKNQNEKVKLGKAIAALEATLNPPIVADASKVTRANYDKILVNMTLNDVQDLLGLGKELRRGGGRMSMRWTGEKVAGKRAIEIEIEFDARAGFVEQVLSKRIDD